MEIIPSLMLKLKQFDSQKEELSGKANKVTDQDRTHISKEDHLKNERDQKADHKQNKLQFHDVAC